jgi:hypothetical protein
MNPSGIFSSNPSESSRGLIISNQISIDTNKRRISIKSLDFDPLELRFATLYWDKLIYPQSTALELDIGGEANLLLKEGILSKRAYRSQESDFAAALLDAYLKTLEEQEKLEPGCWSLSNTAQALNAGNFPAHLSPNHQGGISVRLLGAIPIPSERTPLEEVLEFRQKHRDELLRLRSHIDEISRVLSLTPDNASAIKKAQENIDESCVDIINIFKIKRKSFLPIDLTFNVNMPTMAINGFTIYQTATSLGALPGTSAALAALFGILSTIDIKPKRLGLGALKRNSPFLYVANAHKELSQP